MCTSFKYCRNRFRADLASGFGRFGGFFVDFDRNLSRILRNLDFRVCCGGRLGHEEGETEFTLRKKVRSLRRRESLWKFHVGESLVALNLKLKCLDLARTWIVHGC